MGGVSHPIRRSRLGGLLTVVLATMASLVVAAPASHADGCPPAGGAPHPFATDAAVEQQPHDLIVDGGGFGHGVGMSQYGAQGAAILGCDAATILSTYYPGTTLTTRPSRDAVAVMLRTGGVEPVHVRTTAAGYGGTDLAWVACDQQATTCPTVATQPAGTTWSVTPAVDGTFTLRDAAAPADQPPAWQGGDTSTRLRLMHDGVVVRVVEAVPSGSHDQRGMRLKYGFLELDFEPINGGTTFVTAYVTGGASGLSAMDTYLLGLQEVPYSWKPAALQAQAVAGRSYAQATIRGRETAYGRTSGGWLEQSSGSLRCRCDLFPTTRDQFWTGYEAQSLDTSGAWRQAVTATADRYVTAGDSVAATFYSSSHGDWSSAAKDIWSADIPYLQAVDTSRWEGASGNRLQRWSKGYTKDWLAARFGFDEFVSMTLTDVDEGGRPRKDGVTVTGIVGGQQTSKTYGSEGIRSKLQTYSGLIRVVADDPGSQQTSNPPPTVAPVEIPSHRVAGSSRVETAVAVATRGWDSAQTVVIARADEPADALAGSSLAGKLDAPLLITPSDHLADPVLEEVMRLGARRAVLLGGEKALAPAVADRLQNETAVDTVERVSGPTRIETAVAIATRLAPPAGGHAVLIRGVYPEHPERQWADALAVAGLTARRAHTDRPWVVLVTDGTVHAATRKALEDLQITDVTIAGGTGTIPVSVERVLRDDGYHLDRLAGASRYETSRLATDLDAPPTGPLVIATGDDFADGLAAGALVGRLDGALLLVPSTELAAAAGHEDWVRQRASQVTELERRRRHEGRARRDRRPAPAGHRAGQGAGRSRAVVRWRTHACPDALVRRGVAGEGGEAVGSLRPERRRRPPALDPRGARVGAAAGLLRVVEGCGERDGERRRVVWRHRPARGPAGVVGRHDLGQAAGGARDDGTSACQRLGGDETEPFAMARHGDDGRRPVVVVERGGGNGAGQRQRHVPLRRVGREPLLLRAVAHDRQRHVPSVGAQPCDRLDQVVVSLLGDEPAHREDRTAGRCGLGRGGRRRSGHGQDRVGPAPRHGLQLGGQRHGHRGDLVRRAQRDAPDQRRQAATADERHVGAVHVHERRHRASERGQPRDDPARHEPVDVQNVGTEGASLLAHRPRHRDDQPHRLPGPAGAPDELVHLAAVGDRLPRLGAVAHATDGDPPDAVLVGQPGLVGGEHPDVHARGRHPLQVAEQERRGGVLLAAREDVGERQHPQPTVHGRASAQGRVRRMR